MHTSGEVMKTVISCCLDNGVCQLPRTCMYTLTSRHSQTRMLPIFIAIGMNTIKSYEGRRKLFSTCVSLGNSDNVWQQ